MADKGLFLEKATNLQGISMETLQEFLTTNLSSNTSFIVGMIQEAFKGNYPTLNLDNDIDLLVPDGEETNQMGETEGKEEAVFKMETAVLAEILTPTVDKQQADSLLQDVGYNIWHVGQNHQLKKEELVYINKMSSKGGFKLNAKILREKRAIIKHQIRKRAQKFMKMMAGERVTLKGDLFGKENIWKKRKKEKKRLS